MAHGPLVFKCDFFWGQMLQSFKTLLSLIVFLMHRYYKVSCITLVCASINWFLCVGDFAVLLRAGMTVKQAIIYNCVSSVLGFCGMLIGILVGNFGSSTLWIFACIGGIFIYIAFVDMVSKILKSSLIVITKLLYSKL